MRQAMRPGHLMSLLLLLVMLPAVMTRAQLLSSTNKLCKTIRVSSGRYNIHRNLTQLQEDLEASVSGCEYVFGDMIFQNVGADPVSEEPINDTIRELSTDFLDSIVEITGKLVIFRVNLETITFKNLRTIRGYNPSNADDFFTIEVMQSKYPLQLRFPKLSSIPHGSVRLIGTLHASLYCYLSRRVNWPSLFLGPAQKLVDDASLITLGDEQIAAGNYTAVENLCSTLPKCDATCYKEKNGRQLCWSSGLDGCQSYHRCSTRRCNYCFQNPSTRSEECCDSSCLGGCISESPSGCFACKKVNLDGSCADSCPLKNIYNERLLRMEPNPNSNSSMWQVGNMCMKKCTTPFVSSSDGNHCLSECPQTEIPIDDVCTSCAAKNQKSCVSCSLKQYERVLTDSIAKRFRRNGCAIWRTDNSLDVNLDIPESNSTDSLETLELIQIFFGRLMIKRTDKLLKNLRFLRNIRHVSGILDIMMMETKYLGLANLQSAQKINLFRITGLCSAWFPRKRIEQMNNKTKIFQSGLTFDNVSAECRTATCDPQCLDECWGPGPEMCVKCQNFKVDGRCYATCQEADRYNANNTCQPCHPECAGGCTGPAASNCVRCRHLKEYENCVAECGRDMRADSRGDCYSIASARLFGVGIGVGWLLLALIVLL